MARRLTPRSRRRQGGWLAHRGGGNRRIINLVVSVDQTSLYNAYTAAGSPAVPCDVTVTVNTGVTLQRGFTMGAWPAGTSMKLINGGTIVGTGGNAGHGDSFVDASHVTGASSGSAGGDAVTMTGPLVIDNTSGNIYGGGGGGGGGGSAAGASSGSWTGANTAGGGGGGGGRGYNNQPGGAKGTSLGSPSGDGSNGSAGSSSAGGARGANGTSFDLSAQAGPGGKGGDWGTAGDAGVNGQTGTAKNPGQAGGASGKAVAKNGWPLTFPTASGNNATQVKGPIA